MRARNLTSRTARRRGMTLTELLIVVAIMVILIGMAVPMMRTGIDERRLREATRQVNTACMLAKGMAAEMNRPAGIWIDTQSGSYAQQVFMTETPPPYVGDIVGATATVSGTTAVFDGNSGSFKSLVNKYDLVRFNYMGPYYPIQTDTKNLAGPPFTITFGVAGGMPQPPTPWPPPAPPPLPQNSYYGVFPYQIVRSPAKSSSMPLELPAGIVVDLTQSGSGLSGTEFNSSSPVVVMFQPDGSVERVGVVGGTPVHPTETIHFLVGKIENVGPANLQDNTCLWVSIGAQNGRVTTAENAWPSVWASGTAYTLGTYRLPRAPNGFSYVARTAGISGSSEPTWPTTIGSQVTDNTVQWECCSLIESARQFAQSGQAMGGR